MRQHCIKTFDVNDSPQNVSVDLLVSREADDLAAHGLQQSIPMRSVDDKNSFSDNFLRERALRCKNKIGCRGSISQNAPEPFSTRNFMWKVCTCRLIKHKMYAFVSFIDYGILVMDCEHDWITADWAVKCNKHQTNSTYATPLPIFSIFLRRGFLIHKSTYLCFFFIFRTFEKISPEIFIFLLVSRRRFIFACFFGVSPTRLALFKDKFSPNCMFETRFIPRLGNKLKNLFPKPLNERIHFSRREYLNAAGFEQRLVN